jgi:hypothetical protein
MLARLVSRRGHVFTKFKLLAEEIAHSVRVMHCVLDGEIVCLDPDGRRDFTNCCSGAIGRASIPSICCRLKARTFGIDRLSSGKSDCARSCRASSRAYYSTMRSISAGATCFV